MVAKLRIATASAVACAVVAIVAMPRVQADKQEARKLPPDARPEAVVQSGHVADVRALAFSPDGTLLATGGNDEVVKLWDVASGRELRTFVGSRAPIYTLRFSSDGRRLAAGGWDRIARVWDSATGANIAVLGPHDDTVQGLSFSPDGERLVVGIFDYRKEGNAVSIWDVGSQSRLMRLPVAGVVSAVAFAPNGRRIAVGDGTGPRILVFRSDADVLDREITWESSTRPAGRDDAPSVQEIAWSPDGRWLVGIYGERAILADMTTARPARMLGAIGARHVAFHKNGMIIIGGKQGITLFDPATQSVTTFSSASGEVSPDGTLVAAATGREIVIRDRASGAEARRLRSPLRLPPSFGNLTRYFAVAASPMHPVLAGGGLDGFLRIWDLRASGGPRVADVGARIQALAFDPQGLRLASLSERQLRVWSVADATLERVVELPEPGLDLAFSPRGDGQVAVMSEKRVHLVNALSGAVLKSLDTPTRAGGTSAGAVAWGPDGTLLTGGTLVAGGAALTLWNQNLTPRTPLPNPLDVNAIAVGAGGQLAMGGGPTKWLSMQRRTPGPLENGIVLFDGAQFRVLRGHTAQVRSVALDRLGRVLASGSADGKVKLWDVASGKELASFAAHGGDVTAVAFTSDGRHAVSTGFDGVIRLWSVSDRAAALTLAASEPDGAWIAVTPDGRFDTNRVDENMGLHWVMPDDPYRALAPEVFLRDYFEPNLTAHLMAGESLPPIQSVQSLNRVQPTVEIERVDWTDAAAGRATVTVKLARASDRFPRNGKQAMVTTDAYDLRLFRDGQLVAWTPAGSVEWQRQRPLSEGAEAQGDLPRWRELTRIPVGANGTARLTFPVQVPRRADLQEVKFTAYAFNEDRVKSTTATKTVRRPNGLTTRRGKAYVITLGVNRTESSPAWDLQYAVNDARALGEAVSTRLRVSGQFTEVVPIRLVSDHVAARADEAAATKGHLQVVLDRLAGRAVEAARLAAIPGAVRLERAEPEDLVLLSVSSHGYTDTRGIFHFVLADIGANQPQQVTAALEQRTLSSDELSVWLREVDAGELVLIVDACHSEATVNADGFKPGPMGSRGLGQLAYDKGMRVLTASKAQEAAIERGGRVRQGLLTYALVRRGLENGAADFQPQDGKIDLGEWLAYAVQDVPRLFAEGDARGSIAVKGAPEGTRDGFLGRQRTRARYQQPVLFDFATRRPDIILWSR